MGSGVARALFERYPEVKSEYHRYLSLDDEVFGSAHRLGEVQLVDVGSDKTVLNMFTQNNYGGDGSRYVNYDAIFNCFIFVNNVLKLPKLAIPKIGCGLAGGSWNLVEAIINECTPDTEVWVYEY